MIQSIQNKILRFGYTIRAKIAVGVSVLIGMISCFIYIYFPANFEKHMFQEFHHGMQTLSEMSAFYIAPALYFNDIETINESLESAKQTKELQFIIVKNDTDKIIAAHNLELAKKIDAEKRVGEGLQSAATESYDAHNSRKAQTSAQRPEIVNGIFAVETPIVLRNARIGTLIIGYSAEHILAEINDSRNTILLLSLAVFIIGFFVVRALSAIITEPLSSIVHTVNLVAKGDLSHRAVVKTADEVGNLATDFNTMVESLEKTHSDLKESNHRSEQRAQQLKIEIVERRKAEKEREALNKELNDVARRAGMADVATSVLHNVGNVLNTVSTALTILKDTLGQSKLGGFYQGTNLLKENFENLEDFILTNPKGKKLLEYFLKLEDLLKVEQTVLKENVEKLDEKFDLINDIVSAQQSYANAGLCLEKIRLSEVIDSAMAMQKTSLIQHRIELEKDYKSTAAVKLQKIKLVHIIMNLYSNAKDAMSANNGAQKVLKIELDDDGENAYVRMTDSGAGIKEENLEKIFSYGFTTKEDGHGFGLHSCANYMTEMGGKMWASNSENGLGATFTLQFSLGENEDEK